MPSEQMFTELEQDIPLTLATAAHSGTSFVPEDRGKQERRSYADTLINDYLELRRLADTTEKQDALELEFQRYRAGYKERTLAVLSAKSRTISAMITGPANFPTARNQKRGNTADKRVQERTEYRGRALQAIARVLQPELAPIRTEDANAAERMAAKIAEAEAQRDAMKAKNVEARKVGLESPYSFELTNLGANIRRMKERTVQIEKAQTATATTKEGTLARLEDCPQDNRVRLFFPGKPSEAVRSDIKHRGFRWTPSIGCWQAYRNNTSLAVASQFAGITEDSNVQA